MGRIITFYSYKGGTGRSFLLANVAWILASTGRRILLVDWDLEAPGLHNYFHPFLRDPLLTTSPGLMDWVSDYQSAATDLAADLNEVPLEILERLSDPTPYILALDIKQFDLAGFGTLHLLPAGQQNSTYPDVVNRFNWVRLYERLGGERFFSMARKQMADKYDYILIDSRTGVSDTSGICTLEMPDDLVVCFTLNNQGIRGASGVARTVVAKVPRPDAEIFPVATRIDRSEKLKLQAARRFAREAFKGLPRYLKDDEDGSGRYWGQVEVPYDSFYSYQEVLVPFADERAEIASVFASAERLTGYIARDFSVRMPRLDDSTRKRILARYLGGVDTAIDLQESASQVIARLRIDQIETAKALLLQFIEVGPDGLTSTKPVLKDNLDDALRAMLKEFEQDGVIVPAAQGENILELGEPRLPATWPRLSRWVESERDYLQWLTALRYRVAAWHKGGKADNFLLNVAERTEAQKWLSSKRLDSELIAFIALRPSKPERNAPSEQWLRLAPRPRPLGRNEKWNVFLSYRSVNRGWVLNLYDVLQQLGFAVFLDQVVLVGGDQLARVLSDGLQQSQAAIFVWSSAIGDSEWARQEYETLERQARERKEFYFVPLCLDQSLLPGFARNRVVLDFSNYPDGPNGGELLRLLHAIVGKPLSPEAAHFAAEQDAASTQDANKISAAIRNRDPELLEELFAKGGLAWETSPTLGCKAAEGLIKLGRNEVAMQMLERIRSRFRRAIRPQQLQALALLGRNKDGDLRQAQSILGDLFASGERDPETLAIYGRTWMDRYAQSHDLGDLAQSRDLYVEAFERAPDDYYAGIHAASKSLLLGTAEDLARSHQYAVRVQKIVGTEPYSGDFWKTATAGEVFLLMRNYSNAARLYREAVAMARSERGSHELIWRQACRLMDKLQPSAEESFLIRSAFAHLPDCPATP